MSPPSSPSPLPPVLSLFLSGINCSNHLMSHWTRLTWDWRWGCQLLIRFPFPSWTVSQNHHTFVKQGLGIWKERARAPRKQSLASFLFGSHCLSCSCLNLDYRTHFQFPFLVFLDLCCRIVGNTESGESARKISFFQGLGPRLRHHVCAAPVSLAPASLPVTVVVFFTMATIQGF